MVLKKCSDLKIGMVIAKDVRSRGGDLLMKAGTQMDKNGILTLRENAISFVFVREESENVTSLTTDAQGQQESHEKEEAKKPYIPFSDEKESYYDKIHNSPDFKDFRAKFSSGVVKLRGLLNRILRDDLEGDLVTHGRTVLQGLAMPEGAIPTFDLISNLRRFEDVIYVHSLNVAVLGGMLAEWLGYSKKDIEMVKICGLYHAIGKLTIPPEIISKPSKVSREEYDLIKNYPKAGYEILKKYGANDKILKVAYEHQQRYDGSGYPQGFDPKKIDPFSHIIAIVNVYDAITSVRAYRGEICPFKVIRMFEEEGMGKYDPKVYKVFLEGIANNFIGNRVKLNDGRIAKVLMINKTYFSMPMVIAGAEYIDLSKRRDLYIDEII